MNRVSSGLNFFEVRTHLVNKPVTYMKIYKYIPVYQPGVMYNEDEFTSPLIAQIYLYMNDINRIKPAETEISSQIKLAYEHPSRRPAQKTTTGETSGFNK